MLDEVFRVEEFPPPDGKAQANEFFIVNGGCAANAAVAIARLGGRVALAGPLGGPAGEDANGDRVLAALARENVDCSGVRARCRHVDARFPAIFIDARGDRMIVTYRDERHRDARSRPIPTASSRRPTSLLADNRFPDFVQPICEAARRRGMPVVLDADRPTVENDPLFAIATHVIFSSECLRETTGLRRSRRRAAAHRAPDQRLPRRQQRPGRRRLSRGRRRCAALPVFAVEAVDTLGAGDVFHGGFALALAEGRERGRRHALRRGGRRGSNARASAARPGRRRGPKSRRFWPTRRLRASLEFRWARIPLDME